ncbi:MAG: hypothetical protein HY216_06195, partial [Candidatus Rokubacteria bacterium]|nr:hypothetical protein [Candidatus Rokubacteria bacterium]
MLPLLLLVAYAVAFAATALGTAPVAFDDHPGQLYRLTQAIAHGVTPWRWDPGWWMGYPELQFYPPGFSWAGAALHALALGALDAGACYQALLWLAYLAPGAATWLALSRVLGGGWAALPGAFVALTLSGPIASGVEGGVHIGMAPARLAWALLPALFAVVAPWIAGAARFPLLAIPLLAAVVVTHPAHVPAAVALIALAAAVAPPRAVWPTAAGLVLAAALTGVWTVPLLAHVAETRALAWGALDRTILTRPLPLVLLALAAWALRGPRSPGERVLAWWPWATLGAVLLDAAALEPAGLRWLPADRVTDGAWLAVVAAAGLVVGRLVTRSGREPVVALAVIGLVAVLSLPGTTLALWPAGPADWPTYRVLERGLRLPDLWSALRAAPAGRVLYLRSGVPLVYGTEWWRPHSHVTALTPLAAGRAIIHGTFTHPSPVAALVYRGDAGPGAIRGLAERLDGRELFGRPFRMLDRDTLLPYLDRLGIAVVVALEEDAGFVPGLEDPGLFRRRTIPPFVVYTRWEGVILPAQSARNRWRVLLDGSPGAWVGARVAWYPLWRAEVAGRPLPVRRGALGDLEVRVERPEVVELVYGPGATEMAGIAVSVAGAAALAAWAIGRRGLPGARTRRIM